jgi:nitrite reductase/ring-hydroxylating ferredoxin subunit
MKQDLADRQINSVQLDLLKSLPGTADCEIPPCLLNIPVSEYVDPARFEKEKQRIFFGEPVIVAPSVALPKPKTYRRITLLDVPLLLTRDGEGVVRIFLNVCTHRGTVLCTNDEVGAGGRIVCPYHAWSFALDGQLAGVPRQAIFENLDKQKFGLRQLPSVEAGGLIWVGLDRNKPVDFEPVTGLIADELQTFRLDAMHSYRTAEYDVQANWKLVMDTMLDTYHVMRLHKNTLAKFFVDSPSITERVGRHLRSAGSRANFDRDALTNDLSRVRDMAVFTYNLFPNGIIVLSPNYISLGVLRPVSYNRTIVDYYMLSDGPPDGSVEEGRLERSFDIMHKAFGEEDFWAAGLGQAGLESGALDELTLGGMEEHMKTFHDIVNEILNSPRA